MSKNKNDAAVMAQFEEKQKTFGLRDKTVISRRFCKRFNFCYRSTVYDEILHRYHGC